MSWNYLPEPWEESTAVCCSDTLPFALLKSLRRTASCFCSDSATESCWEEWLMGWPIGSTAFSPLEMARFHEFMQQHGGF